jgi:hypothetical protein
LPKAIWPAWSHACGLFQANLANSCHCQEHPRKGCDERNLPNLSLTRPLAAPEKDKMEKEEIWKIASLRSQ